MFLGQFEISAAPQRDPMLAANGAQPQYGLQPLGHWTDLGREFSGICQEAMHAAAGTAARESRAT